MAQTKPEHVMQHLQSDFRAWKRSVLGYPPVVLEDGRRKWRELDAAREDEISPLQG